MKVWNVIKSVIVWLIVALAACMMIFTIVSVATFDRADRNLFGFKAFIVLSDSMKKTDFNAGDLVLVKEVDPSTLKEGDIIAYTSQKPHIGNVYEAVLTDAIARYHRLRGEEAVRDEEFVRAWCEKEGIPFYSGSGDVRAHARKTGKTVEEAARDLRYAFLRETAKKLNAQLTLAHHADDNAETVLLNLVRGTDLHGLCGMRPKQGNLVRPFLEQTRAELAAYAHSHNIPHVEDRTNADPNAAARNFLRLEILPRLQTLNPRAGEHIAATARSLVSLDDSIERQAEALLTAAEQNDGSIALPLASFRASGSAVQARVLLRMADALGVGRKDIGRDQLSAVLALAQKGGTAARQISLPRGATVRMADGFLTMHLSPAALEKAALTEGVPLHWGNFELTLLRRADGEGISLRALENSEAIFVAPCDLNARLTLEGASGARSVKRLCVDKKITPPERDALPAIYAGDRLAAVWRLGTDISFLPQSEEDARFVRIVPL